MVKKSHFNIMMAGLISAIVAITTATLGLSGTVIGSVVSSILYQVLSSFSEEKISIRAVSDSGSSHGSDYVVRESKNYDNIIGGEIVFLLPIVVITLIELVFLFSSFVDPFVKVFELLEGATNQNLFRVMGLGMIFLAFYPLFKSNEIKWSTGFLVFIIGVIFIFRGIVDANFLVSRVAFVIFSRFDFWIGLVILFLLFVIIIQVISSILSSSNTRKDINNVYRSNVGTRRNINNDYGSNEGFNSQNNVNLNNRRYNPSTKSINASDKTKYFFNDKFEK